MAFLEVHHTDTARAKFFDLSCLRTLCRSCHIRIHAKPKRHNVLDRRWVEKLKTICK